MNIAMTSFF